MKPRLIPDHKRSEQCRKRKDLTYGDWCILKGERVLVVKTSDS